MSVKSTVKNCTECGHLGLVGRGLCRPCYEKARRRGTLHNFKIKTIEDTFMERVKKTKTCWLWTGTKNWYGYGSICINTAGDSVRAHRYAYERFKGTIPEGMVVMHTCDNPPCVNPAHLRIGTKLDNNRDCNKKGRRPRGATHWNCKITDRQIKSILRDNRPQAVIAAQYGVTQGHISHIKCGYKRIVKTG